MQIIKVNNINYFLNDVVYYKSMLDKVDLGIITQTGIMAIGNSAKRFQLEGIGLYVSFDDCIIVNKANI
jgi:hypothetical protein